MAGSPAAGSPSESILPSLPPTPPRGTRVVSAPVLGALLGVLLLLQGAVVLAAQDEGRPAGGGRAFLNLHSALARPVGDLRLMVGGAAGLTVGRSFTVSGVAYVLPSRIAFASPAAPDELEVTMGYGGVRVHRDFGSGPPGIGAELLLGAGNAEVRDPVTEVRFGTDNFVVVQPMATAGTTLSSRFRFEAAVGWRFLLGVEDLAGLEAEDLGGWSAEMRLSAGPF